VVFWSDLMIESAAAHKAGREATLLIASLTYVLSQLDVLR
jgi:hypothetical protein